MKKGFTLVELLAVIAILAIILVIAVPQVNNLIKQTKTNSLASTAKIIAARAEEQAVANKLFGKTNPLNCSDLVKLDDNYGSCTVSVTNDVSTVTLVGANKFAGITCTGTKDNMTCSDGSSSNNTPEYVYSFEQPTYRFNFTITNSAACVPTFQSFFGNNSEYPISINDICSDNETMLSTLEEMYASGGTYSVSDFNACKNWLAYKYYEFNYLNAEDEAEIDSICNNTGGYGETTSQLFASVMNSANYYNQVSSFINMGENIFDNLVNMNIELDNAPVQDFTALKYPNTNTQALLFIRWSGNTTDFGDSNNASVCVLHNSGDPVCFDKSKSLAELHSYASTYLNCGPFEPNTAQDSFNCDDGENSTRNYYCNFMSQEGNAMTHISCHTISKYFCEETLCAYDTLN